MWWMLSPGATNTVNATMTTVLLPVDATAIAGGPLGFRPNGTMSDAFGTSTVYIATPRQPPPTASPSSGLPFAPTSACASSYYESFQPNKMPPIVTVILSPTNAVLIAPRPGGQVTRENCTWPAGHSNPNAQCLLTDVNGNNSTSVIAVERMGVMVEVPNGASSVSSIAPLVVTMGAGIALALLAL